MEENDLLIIDEGFSGLDVENRPRMYQLVKEYQRKYNLTVLEITHNLDGRDRFDEIIAVENRKLQLL